MLVCRYGIWKIIGVSDEVCNESYGGIKASEGLFSWESYQIPEL